MKFQCKLKFNHSESNVDQKKIANKVVHYSLEWLSTVFPSVRWCPEQSPFFGDELIELYTLDANLSCVIYQFIIEIDERDYNRVKLINHQLLHKMFSEYIILGHDGVSDDDDPIYWNGGLYLKLLKSLNFHG